MKIICSVLGIALGLCGCGAGSTSTQASASVSAQAPATDSPSGAATTPSGGGSYQIGGIVSGLTGAGLVLELDGGQDLAIGADGNFVFPQAVASGASYTVTVSAQPGVRRELCAVSSGSGFVGTSNVTTVQVNCNAVIGFLYAATDTSSPTTGAELFSYGIAQGSGTLLPFGTPISVGSTRDRIQLARSADGRLIYVSSYQGTAIRVFAVDFDSGQLTSAGAPVALGVSPISMVMAAGGYLFVSGDPPPGAPLAPATISEYAADPVTGGLTLVGAPIPAGADLTVSADGALLYVLFGRTPTQPVMLAPYRIDPATGALSAGPTKTFGDLIGSVLVGPNDQTLYIVDEVPAIPLQPPAVNLLTYGIDSSTGALTSQIGSLFLDGNGGALIPDTSWQHIYIVDNFSSTQQDSVQAASIDQATGLPGVDSVSVMVPGQPFQLLIDPSGQFAYVLTQSMSGDGFAYLAAYTFGGAGQLTPAGLPQPIGPVPANAEAMAIVE